MEVLEDVELIVIPVSFLENHLKDVNLMFVLYVRYCLTELYVSWQSIMLSEGNQRINYALLFLCDKIGVFRLYFP